MMILTKLNYKATVLGAYLTLHAPGLTSAAFTSSNDIAVYWGQNSYGQSSGSLAQQMLSTYCADTDVDIIMMAFMSQINSGQGGMPKINLGLQTGSSQIGDDIKICQKDHGKKVLLSIGGESYSEDGFDTPAEAISTANLVWNMFGPEGNSGGATSEGTAAITRPFGDAVIDGFDLDLEKKTTNFPAFASQLRSLMAGAISKQYYLTAAPQCPFPDQATKDLLYNSTIKFDAVFVQFYNNYCGLASFVPGSSTQTTFNFDVWDQWARNSSDVKVFLGVPAGQTATGSDYVDVGTLEEIVEYCKGFKSFGGVMMWDASQASANDGFLEGVKSALGPSGLRRGGWRGNRGRA